ncbi:MAG: TIR domain-containing protein [Burkholderiales bacterium]|nr:TIR domain-containing protein [Burkholderiales bacterium]
MAEKKKLENVFKTVGLPPYTYVKPAYYGEVRADISQPGKHLLIEGPSGIGKTCVAFKVFEELGWAKDDRFSYVSCRDGDAAGRIDAFFEAAGKGEIPTPSVIVIDDFHLLPTGRRAEIGSTLKRMSDRAFEHAAPPKAILIGIPTTGVSLLSNAYDLGPRLGTYVLSRASDVEIDRLISEGETALNVLFEDRNVLLAESAGNFWLAQYVCNKVCATQEAFETQEDTKILTFDLLGIRQRLMTELTQRYMSTARTFAKGKRWRPGGNKPYLEILLALCKIPESVVTFDKVLNVVPERRRPGIKAVRSRITEVIYDSAKESDLRKQVAFDPDAGFSIEDPLFRYFLTNLDPKRLFQELGIEDATVEKGRLYSYDIGFSFAGETRRIVEAINSEMKAEDVVTFYDYDQQAFLLALDLEKTLGRVYAESCRYYLVFLDNNYRDKVWTKYEKDVMTSRGRKEHIIPVLLDESGAAGAVGIPATVGRIDLRDVWSEVLRTGDLTRDAVNALRNRCVLPILEKLDAPDGAV